MTLALAQKPETRNSKLETSPRVFQVAQLMKPDEVIAWLQIEKGTLYGWVHRRQIPFRKLGPAVLAQGRERERDARALRFDYYEILEWLRTGALPEWFTK